jgi:hypothetical protein
MAPSPSLDGSATTDEVIDAWAERFVDHLG